MVGARLFFSGLKFPKIHLVFFSRKKKTGAGKKFRGLKFNLQAKKKTYGTADSHVVPHHSTDAALSSLTLQIERDAVLLAWYGRR